MWKKKILDQSLVLDRNMRAVDDCFKCILDEFKVYILLCTLVYLVASFICLDKIKKKQKNKGAKFFTV